MVKLYDAEAAAKKAVKEATMKLDELALGQYAKLTTEDVQALVIDDKWGGAVGARIEAEVTTLGQALVTRLRTLAERYELTAGDLDAKVEELTAKVREHLAEMGVRG
ncbi:hypothetical protein [Micromonospora aurantiaca (nom. illeg.)]|uniref:hypothetical protein n=1 Tax=Micromonospora aurantiaca (nom. illeg.) TaxID=47850 RepID=UPI0016173ECA